MSKPLSSQQKQLKYFILGLICVLAFSVRLFSVVRYESVIHEFDPYFNYRSTKYLIKEGIYNFLDWFDDTTWYPLGRIVGGTLYPGLMVTAGVLDRVLEWLHLTVDIRNVCVLMGPLFSTFAALATHTLAADVWGDGAGVAAAALMAAVPGYISRSVAGSYDNECVAIFALVFAFCCWIKALRSGSLRWGCATAFTYFYMVSSWGGYVFIINIIALHAFTLILTGRYSSRLYIAYSSTFVLGTLLSMQISFVNYTPIKSSEHLSFLGVFGLIQLCAAIEWLKGRLSEERFIVARRALIATAVFAGVFVFAIGTASGKISPWGGRLYSLLDPTYAKNHIPIIASVSEHQPTSWGSFFFDLHIIMFLILPGIYICFKEMTEGTIFLLIYTITSVYFSAVMVRLILVLAPITCIIAGGALSKLMTIAARTAKFGKNTSDFKFKREFGFVVLILTAVFLGAYVRHCVWVASEAYSSPSVVLAATQPDGSRVIFDDFRESYRWLSHNTPEDARIMSWWDYGYQMSQMANRTVFVDNNTWNNTHIATIGKVFALDEERSYELINFLGVDYVMVLFGGYSGYSGDDINKFIWMIRIAGSVDPSIKDTDFYSNGRYTVGADASPTLYNSLMFKLSYYDFGKLGSRPYDRVRGEMVGHLDYELHHFEEAFTSPHWLVRIFKVLKPNNRVWNK